MNLFFTLINGHPLLGAIGLVPSSFDSRRTSYKAGQRMVRTSGICAAV
jgi:hypothetical protein